MMRAHHDAVRTYAFTAVAILGILGNALVILSILRQRCLLKSNYYFAVLCLSICDLSWLLIVFIEHTDIALTKETLFGRTTPVCIVMTTKDTFSIAGIYMMLIISMLRYRAAVHPLKPAISRRKLKIVCALGYIIGLVVTCPFIPFCFENLELGVVVAIIRIFILSLPTILLCVVYYKICRAVVRQSKFLKRMCSNPYRRRATSSIKILRYSKNQRTFLVCFATVFFYTAGLLPLLVYYIWFMIDNTYIPSQHWLHYIYGYTLRVAGSCSVNPLIYGILDKKLLVFWKLFPRRKRTI